MKKARVVRIVLILFLAASTFFGCAKTPDLPQYSVPVIAFASSDPPRPIGAANAFLVDDERGFFVTCAHVVADGENFYLRIGGNDYRAEMRAEWINWEADLALVRIDISGRSQDIAKPFFLLEPPPVKTKAFPKGRVLAVKDEDNNLFFKDHIARSVVEKIESDWGIVMSARLDMLTLRILQARGYSIPKEQLSKLYEHYIVLDSDKAGSFPNGMSGSPVMTADGKVIGVICAASNYKALAVPAYEVIRLLKKARK